MYYDSKGTSPVDEKCNVKYASCSVLHIMATVRQVSPLGLLYNYVREQHWYMPFQCGSFAYNFIERYLMVPELLKLKKLPLGGEKNSL